MPFTDPAARGVVQDIIDGFYPYQLREDFPEGAHLVLLDKAGMTYVPTSARGEGAGAGGAAGAPQQAGNVHGMASLGQPKDGPRTKEEYLKKLPETVIKNGKIVELRKGISDFISGRDGGGNAGRPPRDAASQKDARSGPHAAGGPLATSAIDRLLKRGPSSKAVTSQLLVGQHKSAGPSRSPSVRGSLNEKAASAVEVCAESDHSDEPCATLQIKAEDGRMHVLKMAATATIGQLRSKLDILRVPQGPYEIRSAFPPRAYSDLAETLEAAGLVPNATLFARATRS
ncbi:unnamed protein product [Pedinophyceae sp. YPF-701]|nr:unnamed protein product [Pedinophyceae sp. YPF-701]